MQLQVEPGATGGELPLEFAGHQLVVSLRQDTACDARLVSDDYREPSRRIGPRHRVGRSRQQGHLGGAPDEIGVDDQRTVAIEEEGRLQEPHPFFKL